MPTAAAQRGTLRRPDAEAFRATRPRQVAEVINEVAQAQLAEGVLIVPKAAGVFLCRKPTAEPA